MATKQQRGPRSKPEIAGLVAANAIKVAAVGLAFHEATGEVRASVLGFAAFMLTVAQSVESSVTTFFAGKR